MLDDFVMNDSYDTWEEDYEEFIEMLKSVGKSSGDDLAP